jgi:hypothetical protein
VRNGNKSLKTCQRSMKVRESGAVYSEKETMISAARTGKYRWRLSRNVGLFVVFFSTFYFCNLAFSEMSDRELETELVSKKRDFNEFLRSRLNSSEQEVLAARAHVEERREEEQIQKDLEASYRRQMKRYSMEEIEIQDRADEERLRLESLKVDNSRGDFIARRDRHREIERSIAPVDGNLEFQIEVNKEPDFKSSYPVNPLGGGGKSF